MLIPTAPLAVLRAPAFGQSDNFLPRPVEQPAAHRRHTKDGHDPLAWLGFPTSALAALQAQHIEKHLLQAVS